MNLSKFLFSLLFSLIFSLANGQDTTKIVLPEVVSLNKVNIFIPSLGLEREQKIGRTSTLSVGINYQFTFLREYNAYINYSYGSGGYYISDIGVKKPIVN